MLGMTTDDGGDAGDVPVEEDLTDKPAVYIDERLMLPVYRASALYGCDNALYAARMGIGGSQPPDWMQDRYDAGHDHEPLILGKIERKFGFKPYGFQMSTELEVGDFAMIRGHIDALDPLGNDPLVTHFNGEALRTPTRITSLDEEYGGKPIVVDAKALSQGSFEKWEKSGFYGFPYYGWQQRIYIFSLDLDGVVMAVKNKNTDAMIVDYYPATSRHLPPMGDIFSKVIAVETKAREQGEAALFDHDCTQKQYPCPYWTFCWERPSKDKVDVKDEDTLGKVAVLVRSREEHRQAEAEAKTQAAEIDSEIVSLVGGGLATARTSAGTVSTYHASSQVVDWAAIAAELKLADATAAKEKFSSSKASSKLSIRVTPIKKKAA